MNLQNNPLQSSYHMMAKPIGSICNLDCKYCYYLEKKKLYPINKDKYHMSDKVLELFIASYIQGQTDQNILFTWHGGEPLMRGKDFFTKALEFQKKYSGGKTIENSLQTNGTLLTDDLAKYFKDNKFLIGISIDGPEHCHNHYRRYKNGMPSFVEVMNGVELLIKHGVEFNTLSVVNNYNSKFPLEVYHFLKQIGSRYMQFIPIVEWMDPSAKSDQLLLQNSKTKKHAIVTDWSVNSADYGKFLISIFDEWVSQDVGTYYVLTYDAILANWAGVPPNSCIYAKTCGHAGVMEYNGDVYSCDHFVFPEHKLGNICETPLAKMMQSDMQKKFGMDKWDSLPNYCQQCVYLNICTGECPKNRIINTPDGQSGLNYLCAGLKMLYAHTEPYMKFMLNELNNNRAPSNVMAWSNRKHTFPKSNLLNTMGNHNQKGVKIHRNDPCPCGSKMPYKKCCALVPRRMR